MTIKVLVADDHNLFRQGLISLIKTRSNEVEVIGEAATGKETIRLAKELQPDVILMDIYMPEGGGLEATKLIKEEFPGIIIVILTSSEEDKHIYEAVQLGASGYLLKSLNANELFDLLNGVIRGEAAMTRAMASRLLKTVAKQST
jgi:two-component system, NarL family, nitrate/nitrite response regulator NarL